MRDSCRFNKQKVTGECYLRDMHMTYLLFWDPFIFLAVRGSNGSLLLHSALTRLAFNITVGNQILSLSHILALPDSPVQKTQRVCSCSSSMSTSHRPTFEPDPSTSCYKLFTVFNIYHCQSNDLARSPLVVWISALFEFVH